MATGAFFGFSRQTTLVQSQLSCNFSVNMQFSCKRYRGPNFAGDTTEHAGLLRKVVLPIMKLVFFAVIGRSKLG